MQEFIFESERAALKRLRRGDLVGVYTSDESEGKRPNCGGPFWYYRGVVVHHHRDGRLTVRVIDDTGLELAHRLRFDTAFRAERSTPQWFQRYTLLPWTQEIERHIKIQKIRFLCWQVGSGWTQLTEQELDEATSLAQAAFSRFLASNGEHHQTEVGTLPTVLSLHRRAVLSLGSWRFVVRITNNVEGSGVLHISSTLAAHLNRPPAIERFFASLEACERLLAEIADPCPIVPTDATWRASGLL